MGVIDEVSHELGTLKARLDAQDKTIASNHAITNKKLDKLIEALPVLHKDIGNAHRRIDTVKEGVDDWKKTKRNAIKAAIGVSAASGAAGAAAPSGFAKLIGFFGTFFGYGG